MKKIITLLILSISSVSIGQSVSIQGGDEFPNISAAVAAAVAGDVILISGTHTESVTIDKSITLKGTNPSTDIIQAAASPGTGGSGSRVILIAAPIAANLNVGIENLTIRHGNSNANGGGINIDKVIGLVTLKNLVITNNFTTTNGGGIGIAGSNVNLVDCSVVNNSSNLDGGGIIAAPNNASGVSSSVNISQS